MSSTPSSVSVHNCLHDDTSNSVCFYIRGAFVDGSLAPLLEELREFNAANAFTHDFYHICGAIKKSPRTTLAFSSIENDHYTYSGQRKYAQAWSPRLLQVKMLLEDLVCHPLNFALVNRYHGGSHGIGHHSDNEKRHIVPSFIVSLSLGASRRFVIKHKHDKTVPAREVLLAHGDIIIMNTEMQNYYTHAVPKTARHVEERFSITFRHFTQ